MKADLSVPKEMGGPGRPGTTTPEHLFAAGYAACFGAPSTSWPRSRKEAHEQICPYSHATRGNVPVDFTVTGG